MTKDGVLNNEFGVLGELVTDIGSASDDRAYAVAIQPDDAIVVAGRSNANGTPDFALIRIQGAKVRK